MNIKKEELENLDWECVDADTKYLTHNIHRYSGKFIPQIAKNAIESLTSKGDLVLDVYCGSGTTLLECFLSGRRSIGVDLNPVAKLITDVKITPVENELVHNWKARFIEKVRAINTSQKDLLSEDIKLSNTEHKLLTEKLSDEWFQKWFQPVPLKELCIIQLLIAREENLALRNIANLAFSDVLRKNSNAHSGYPNVMFDKNKRELGSPINSFVKRLNEICDAVSELTNSIDDSLSTPATTLGSNTNLAIEDETIDAVITHPPYIGSVPYAEYGLLSLKWLGYDPKKLDAELTGGQRQRKTVVERFESDYYKMFTESFRVLKSESYMFIMVGNPTVKGEVIDLSEMSDKAALSAGFSKVKELRRNGVNRRANKMGHESMIFYRKP